MRVNSASKHYFQIPRLVLNLNDSFTSYSTAYSFKHKPTSLWFFAVTALPKLCLFFSYLSELLFRLGLSIVVVVLKNSLKEV